MGKKWELEPQERQTLPEAEREWEKRLGFPLPLPGSPLLVLTIDQKQLIAQEISVMWFAAGRQRNDLRANRKEMTVLKWTQEEKNPQQQ